MAVDLTELDRFDAERPKPPGVLYKYVVPARVDVLEGASIRFTPPLNTNDIFEVRQSFDLIWGPKMHAYFKEMSKELDFEDPIANAFRELGLGTLPDEHKAALLSSVLGPEPRQALQGLFGLVLDQMPALVNERDRVDDLLERVASKQLLLSLSERQNSPPMWAHYADDSKGFVIAFDTSSEFFRRGEQNEQQGLHKVRYFDGRVGEIIDDPFAALISKQADWSYEREWRLYVKPENVTRVLEAEGDTIHLVAFPREAVKRIILGVRTTEEDSNKIRAVLDTSYPQAELTRMQADRITATLVELPIG